jgi:hypothetical protein
MRGEGVMTLYLANAFSLGMLEGGETTLKVREISVDEATKHLLLGFKSVVGHEVTAKVLSTLLNVKVDFNREAIKLRAGDMVIVFQLLTRLPEGKTLTEEEMQKLEFKFYLVGVME